MSASNQVLSAALAGSPEGERAGTPLAWRCTIAALLLLTLAAYLPLWRAGFIWDDDAHITENLTLINTTGLRDIWLRPGATPQYYPLVHTTFWLEHQLWGQRPLGFHLVNVALHGAAALLLLAVLARLGLSRPAALLTAVIFALHPVHVESVAWITERKNVLSGLLYLGSAWAYLRFWGELSEQQSRRGSRWWWLLALLLFVLALCSKTVTCSLPAALLLVAYWKRGRVPVSDVLGLAPFFVIGLVMGLHTAHLERTVVGAVGPEWELSLLQRCLIAGRALWFYLGKLLWPQPLTFIYPRWRLAIDQPWQYLFPLAALALLATLWRMRKQWGRGPLVALLFFAGTLLPSLGFFNVYPMRYSFVADHFQYLASLGPIVLGAVLLARVLGPRRCVLLAGALGLLLGTRTFLQTRIYQGPQTLWESVVADNPSAWMAWGNLGQHFLRQGDFPAAEAVFSRQLALGSQRGGALQGLGALAEKRGEEQQALAYYQQALALDPTSGQAHLQLGQLLGRLAQTEQAEAHLRAAIYLSGDSSQRHLEQGRALTRRARERKWALVQFREAVRKQPQSGECRREYGAALAHQGQLQEALEQLTLAVRFAPDDADAHAQRGAVLLLVDQPAAAATDLAQAAALAPRIIENYSQWARALDLAGNKPEAAQACRQGIGAAKAAGKTFLAQQLEQQLAALEKALLASEPASP